MSLSALLFAFVFYIVLCDAYTFSHPNCTLPSADVHNFVSAPNTRGTLDILWSCLAIACTYTVLHLNVPEQRNGRDSGWKGNLRWFWKSIWPSLKWTTLTILGPEFYTTIVIEEFIKARRLLTALQSLPENQHPVQGWTLTHAFFIQMGGFAIRPYPSTDFRGEPNHLAHLTGKSLIRFLQQRESSLRESDEPKETLMPSESDIMDRSKSDLFAKWITAMQILYFCVNCFVRFGRRLPTTLLELGTLGFAACSMVSYAFLIKKPRGISNAIVLPLETQWDLPPARTMSSAAAPALKQTGSWSVILSRSVADTHSRMPDWEEDEYDYDESDMLIYYSRKFSTIVLGVALGAIHVAGWNFAFPSLVDRWLWRSCAVASIALPAAIIAFVMLRTLGVSTKGVGDEIAVAIGLIYMISRIILMAEMVRCLFYLPAEAYVTTWAANIPHIG